MVFKGKG